MSSAEDPRFIAGVKLLERTGALEFQLRYQDDEAPTVWIAAARWSLDTDGRPQAKGGRTAWDCAAALNPLRAVLRLCDQVVDGGTCAHCGKPTGVSDDIDAMPGEELICWYQFDPELATYRRGCE